MPQSLETRQGRSLSQRLARGRDVSWPEKPAERPVEISGTMICPPSSRERHLQRKQRRNVFSPALAARARREPSQVR